MTELDRYDWAFTLVAGAIIAGILMLGAPIWAPVPIMMVTVFVSVRRHTPEIPPIRLRRRRR